MTTHPNPYFGGSSVHGGRVRRLDARDFPDLVRRYVFLPCQLNMDRRTFLVHPDRDSLKDGPYITACSWDFNEGHREDATATSVHMVILDLDDSRYAKDYDTSPDALCDALHPYNFVAWRTAKYTPDEPRLKIAVDVSPCDPAEHRRIVAFVCSRLAIPQDFKGIRESKVLSQPQYRPVQFRGEAFSAVIASRLDGCPVELKDVPETPETADERSRIYAFDPTLDGDVLNILHLPVAGVTPEDIREALFSIDPSCGYKTWTEIACSLRHQFQDEDEARRAYLLFDEWSSLSKEKYYGEKETYAKWKSFRPYAKGRAPVTIRSLFKHAMDAGWENTKVAVKIKQRVEEWIAECQDGEILMSEGPQRIAEMPLKNDVVEEALVVRLRQRIIELTGAKVDKATIKKQVREDRYKQVRDAMDPGLEPWLQPIVFVKTLNEFRDMINGNIYSPAAFDNTFSIELMPKDKESETAKSGRPAVLPTHYALNVRDIPKVDGTTYDPRQAEDENGAPRYIFEWEGRTYLNEFSVHSYPQDEPFYADRAERLIEELLRVLIAEPDYRRRLLDYMCYLVQSPGQKVRWCPIIQSAQGAGKGTIGDIMRAALGPRNYEVIDPSALASDFNSWRYGRQLVVFDELRSPGHNKHEVGNKLKPAITNEAVTVNEKFRNPRVVQNVTNYIAFTNFKDAMAIEETDRRYFVIHSPIQSKEQVLNSYRGDFFDEIHHTIDHHPGAIRYWLKRRDISRDFKPNGHAHETPYLLAMIESSKNDLLRRIERVIADADDPLVQSDLVCENSLERIVRHEMRGAVLSIPHCLRTNGFEMAGRFSVDGEKTDVWVHPSRFCLEVDDPEKVANERAAGNSRK